KRSSRLSSVSWPRQPVNSAPLKRPLVGGMRSEWGASGDPMPSRLHRRTLKKRYEQFWRAVRKRDRAAIVRLILSHPELHSSEGNAGAWVDLLNDEAPELLELAFQAGLHPDAGQEGSCATLLQGAAAEGDVDKVCLALRFGADPELRNDWGEVALGYA